MKTHFDAEAPFDSIRMVAETDCGAGKGVSQYGLDATSNPAFVDCKRCLKRIEAAETEQHIEQLAAMEKAFEDAKAPAPVTKLNEKPQGDRFAGNDAEITRIHPENTETVTKGEHVTAGPMSFWDVREAIGYVERQAFTRHNVYLASVMAHTTAATPVGKAVQALIEERDTLLYTKGYDSSSDATTQYLAGRIAGIEFALRQFGVKGF